MVEASRRHQEVHQIGTFLHQLIRAESACRMLVSKAMHFGWPAAEQRDFF